VDPPEREVQLVAVEGPLPGDGVVVRRVDEGAVDVEQDGGVTLRGADRGSYGSGKAPTSYPPTPT
jgi:uncharacterized protein (DUF2345 family)